MFRDSEHFYEFAGFRLIPAERRLSRDGEPVPLTPKAFDLLVALVEQHGRLMTKESLIERIWPGTFVEENNLADNISRLRKALGESGGGVKFIETVPRQGYRFIASVTVVGLGPEVRLEPPARASFRPARWALALSPLLVACAIWFQMRLSGRAEARNLEFKGSFYYSQWTEPEIRKGIAFHQRAIDLDPDSANFYNGLSTGWQFLADLYASPRDTMPHAKAAIAKALEKDPANAWAHSSKGLVAMQYDWDWPAAEAEFRTSLRIEPDFDSAHILFGWYLMAKGQLQDAVNEIRPVTEAKPLNDFSMWSLGLAFHFSGRLDEAIEQFRRAVEIDRRSHWAHMLLGWSLERQGKYAEAIAESQAAYRVNDNPQVLASLGHIYARSGQQAEARGIVAELTGGSRRYVSPYDVAVVFAGLGDHDKAMEWLEKAREERSGWLALWIKVDPRFDALRPLESFQRLVERVGHRSR